MRPKKEYDEAYFDRWYRSEEEKIDDGGELRRRVATALAVTEQILRRNVRTVLDVGCGEGRWAGEIRRSRKVEYLGLDPSPYVVRRFGREKNIRRGSFGDLRSLDRRQSFDLVVCSDVLHYLPAREIDAGLDALVDRLDGVAYLALYTVEDEPTGDLEGWYRRSAGWYRERFERYGLRSCGMQCYVGPSAMESASSLDLL